MFDIFDQLIAYLQKRKNHELITIVSWWILEDC